MRYRKDNITLQIRVPVALAVSLLGRLYGMGLLSREDYIARLDKVSHIEAEKERHKNKRLSRLLEKASEKGAFFNKKKI